MGEKTTNAEQPKPNYDEHIVSAKAQVEADRVKGLCSFAAFQRSQAFLRPLGGAMIVASFAALHFGALINYNMGSDGASLGAFLDEVVRLLSKDLIDTNYAQQHVVSMLLFVIMIILGSIVLKRAGNQKRAYREAYPFLSGRTDPSALKRDKERGRRLLLSGCFCLGVGIMAIILTRIFLPVEGDSGLPRLFNSKTPPLYNAIDGVIFLVFAAAMWFFVRGVHITESSSILAYNLEALTERSIYEVEKETRGADRDAVLAAKGFLDTALYKGRVFLYVCLAIMLCIFVLPTLASPFWWVPLVVGLVGRDLFVAFAVRKCKRELGYSLEKD